MASTTQVFVIVFFFVVLIIQALIYLYRTQSFSWFKREDDAQKSRYDSKVSLCSLVFDPLNSVLSVAYDKREIQIAFADIARYEVIANTDSLIEFDRNNSRVFDAETERKLRSQLNEIEKEDLPKVKIRQIDLKFTHKAGSGSKDILVNFYFRKGNSRLSRYSFAESVDDIVTWCALLESVIHPSTNTEPEAVLETDADSSELSGTPKQPDSEVSPSVREAASSEVTQAKQKTDNLADEITRLAELKVKGFLSEAEFQKAKNKILN